MAIVKLLTGGILICGLAVAGGCRGPAANGDPVALSGTPLVISDGSAEGWRAQPADGVTMALADDDGALRLDFGFTGGGYAIARREVDLALPQNYAFSFRLRGACPVNTLEFKLVDETGENVWWRVERAIEFPAQWRTVTIKKRQLEFAWGPGGGAPLRGISAVEIVVTAAEGGVGSVWIDDLTLQELP
ncbi:carbohydrate-binding protein, partial [bacterium]|nr:carbohydrate-binding protein [bacterium]